MQGGYYGGVSLVERTAHEEDVVAGEFNSGGLVHGFFHAWKCALEELGRLHDTQSVHNKIHL